MKHGNKSNQDSAGIWTQDLLHPEQESYPSTIEPHNVLLWYFNDIPIM